MSHKTQQQQRLSSVLGYIETHLHLTIDVETLADMVHWSRWQLQRVFNANTGLSVAQYVRQLRLSQSAMLLISGDQRHIDIAMNTGFGSEVSFNRAFKQHFGCTPQTYRKRGIPTGIRFSLNNAPMRSIRLEQRKAFVLEGLHCDIFGVFSPKADFKDKVPRLWQDTINTFHSKHITYERLISVIDVALFSNAKQRYWCGRELSCDASTATHEAPLERLFVPEQLYAVITHRGDPQRLSETIIWFINHWLNPSPYEAFEGFDIEELSTTGDFDGKQNAIDYWIPIRPVKVQ